MRVLGLKDFPLIVNENDDVEEVFSFFGEWNTNHPGCSLFLRL